MTIRLKPGSAIPAPNRVQEKANKPIVEHLAAQVETYDRELEQIVSRRRADDKRVEETSRLKAACNLIMQV